jgi:hypothetical protein
VGPLFLAHRAGFGNSEWDVPKFPPSCKLQRFIP